jgi:hypothetical protein
MRKIVLDSPENDTSDAMSGAEKRSEAVRHPPKRVRSLGGVQPDRVCWFFFKISPPFRICYRLHGFIQRDVFKKHLSDLIENPL